MEKLSGEHENFTMKRRLVALLGAGAIIVVTSGCVIANMSESNRQSHEIVGEYPVHHNVTATVFWAGEGADGSNDYIHNRSSAWMTNWVAAYGGVDEPTKRCDYAPCDFTPNENSFYFALPFGDYAENGPKSADELKVVPWANGSLRDGESLLKNRWIEVSYNDKKAYAQWEDVGPFEENDAEYVFGDDQPKESRAGLDMSPGLSDYLGVEGRASVSWRFIEERDVPEGPWRKVITRSKPDFSE
jgi:hypothetical protein